MKMMNHRGRPCLLAGLILMPLLASLGQGAAPAESKLKISTEMDAGDFQSIIEHAKQKVFPALVFIKPIIEDYESGEKKKQQVFGSGVIVSPDGLVLTNHHVVEKAVKVSCVLFDKDQVQAKVIGKDIDTDLALLKMEFTREKPPLPFGEFADSTGVREGDFVMALGSPYGFVRSISLGIVSNTQRYLGFESRYEYNTWLQTDAAINPGNSGGPLVNTQGKIVGINTLGIVSAESVGFAIPSNVARAVLEKLKHAPVVERAWTGIKLQPLKDFFTDTITSAPSGVLISDVESGSPAQQAGIHKGDILLAAGGKLLDGTYIENVPAIRWQLAELPVSQPVEFKILRGGVEQTIPVTPVMKGKVEGDDFECRRWNMTIKEINQYRDPELHFYCHKGVYVQGIRYPGNADQAGLQRGDIILTVERNPIETLEALKGAYEELLKNETREKRVLLEVLRNGYKNWVVLDYSKDYEKGD